MAKVLCTLPNASEEIRDVKFTAHEKGMLSEDISDEVAAVFASIPGYQIVGESTKPIISKVPDDDAKAAKAAEREALLAKADAIGMTVKSTWGNERLAAEIEAAEKAAAQ